MLRCVKVLAMVVVLHCSTSFAMDVKFRLIRNDAPDQLVSTAITTIDMEAELANAAAALPAKPDSNKGSGPAPDVDVKPKAKFDSYCNVMRRITIDKTHPFQRMYNGSFLGHTDTLTLPLDAGEHVIDPGEHKFKIENERITTADPALKIDGTTIDVMVYPITIVAVDGSAVRQMPAEMLRLPVMTRIYLGSDDLLPKEKYLDSSATFKRLTLYMLANISGTGYRLAPSDRLFYVTPDGVQILGEDGKPTIDKSVRIQDKFSIILPKVAIPVTIRGSGVTLQIEGSAGNLLIQPGKDAELTKTFYAFGSREGASIVAGCKVKSEPMLFEGDLGTFSRRKIVVDANATESKEPRLLQVETEGFSVDAGKALRVRVKFQDAYDQPTISPARVQAFLQRTPALLDDGCLQSAPAINAPNSSWTSLRIMAGPGPNLYDVVMPDVPSSAYWLRVVVDGISNGSPESALRADFLMGVINPAARSNLSAFCPIGRHSFLNGSDIPFSVVLKSTVPVAAGHLRVTAKRDGNEYTLIDREVEGAAAGSHPFHYLLKGAATQALMPGDYTLSATLGKMTSNTWTLRLRTPRRDQPFPVYAQGFLCQNNIETGAPYINLPESVAMANEARALYQRNAEILGRTYDIVTPEWTFSEGGPAQYQGRDSSSEVAQVERMLRDELSLPSPEVYYYQNAFESCCEALTSQGMGMVLHCGEHFAKLSLIHSVEKEVKAKMREYQLAAQIGQRFELIDSISFYRTETKPMGDSELGDANRTTRYKAMHDNFVAKQGFEPPPASDASKVFFNTMNGADSSPELRESARRWEEWANEENMLVSNYNARGRAAVKAVAPNLKLHCEGPPHGYPVTNSQHEDIIQNCVGTSDAGWPVILDSFLRPRIMGMTGKEIVSVMGTMSGAGPRNIKTHVVGAIAAGAHGIGYYWGSLPVTFPEPCTAQHVTKEFRDVRELLDAYGAMFCQLKTSARIGIFYPYHQMMYDQQVIPHPNFRPTICDLGACAATAQLALLGYDSEVVSEEMLATGALERLDVLILPALYHARPEHVQIIEKFAAGGKTVLAGSLSTLLPKGARKIDDDFAELSDANVLWTFQTFADIGNSYIFSEMLRKVGKLREVMSPLCKPFASATNNRVFVQTSAAGDAKYTFVWDCLYPSWMGTDRVNGNADCGAGGGEANETTQVPLKEPIYFSNDLQTYDLLTQQPVAKEKQADGTFSATCDLSTSPFRIFVTLPKAIASLHTELPAATVLGQSFAVKIAPLDAEGKLISASVPLRITVYDATGKLVQKVPACAGPEFNGSVNATLGFASGKWKIIVAELISGRQTELSIAVAAPDGLPFGQSVIELPVVDVQRPSLVREFIENRKKDGETVLILLQPSQSSEHKALAEEALKQLTALGIKAEIHLTTDTNVFLKEDRVHLFQGWSEFSPVTYIESPVMLIGGEGVNTLIEELQENQLLLRPLTSSYPGPGHGVLCAVRSPFAQNRDVLCALGPDAAGIRAAIARLGAHDGLQAEVKKAVADTKTVPQTGVEKVLPDSPLAQMDGDPVQSLALSAKGDQLLIGTSGYARNIFVLDLAGKVVVEDKVGYVNTQMLKQLPDGAMAVESDGNLYLREPNGAIRWRLPFHRRGEFKDYVDDSGRYMYVTTGNGFFVYDMNLKPLWGLDDWDKAESKQDILYGRTARFIGAIEQGNTIVYRLTGKGPGVASKFGDDIIFCEALTGKEIRRVPVDVDSYKRFVGIPSNYRVRELPLTLFQNGANAVANLEVSKFNFDILFDNNFQLAAFSQYELPPFHGGKTKVTNRYVLKDRRSILTEGDALCVTNAEWTRAKSVKTAELILSMAVDETRNRVAISDYAGRIGFYDFDLQPIWESDVGSAARLMFLPDGRLLAGTLRGQARLIDSTGKTLWTQALTRYAPPADVEKRWSELEKAPTLDKLAGQAYADIEKNVELGEDLAHLSGNVDVKNQQRAACAGVPFGTYLVEWTYGGGSDLASLSLDIVENEKTPEAKNRIKRVALTAKATQSMSLRREILRLGDSPENFEVSVQNAADSSVKSSVTVRQLKFPSEDIIRIPSLYRNPSADAAFKNKVAIQLFYNLTEGDLEGQWSVPWIEPLDFVNGHMLEREPRLLNGKWFGSSNTAQAGTNGMIVPCVLDVTLPGKHVISHVVIAEDPSLLRVESICIEAFLEAKEMRSNVRDDEKRQAARGYLMSVVKKRGNASPYNVYKLEKPVYTRRLQISILSGASSINEIELYETPLRKTDKPDGEK